MAVERQPVSSRIIKKERSKLLRQSVIFGVAAIGLGLVFIFFVLPNFVAVIERFQGEDATTETVEQSLIQSPVLGAPISATNSASLKVSGVAQPNLQVTFVVNGNADEPVTSDESGAFSGTVELTEGQNLVTAFVTTEDGNESKTGREYQVIFDTQPPTLELSQPEENQSFDSKQRTIEVVGTTEPETRVFLQDRVVFARSDGSFSTSFSPSSGENKFVIKAVDDAGNTTQLDRTVTVR